MPSNWRMPEDIAGAMLGASTKIWLGETLDQRTWLAIAEQWLSRTTAQVQLSGSGLSLGVFCPLRFERCRLLVRK